MDFLKYQSKKTIVMSSNLKKPKKKGRAKS